MNQSVFSNTASLSEKIIPEIYCISIQLEALASYSNELKIETSTEAIYHLAKGIACSPCWGEMSSSILIARPHPYPVLAVLGCFDEAAKFRIKSNLQNLNKDIARVRYANYQQAEIDSQKLAEKLIERFGHKELKRFQFTAIPRGGFIVLSMLAYSLGLTSEQLQLPHSPDVPLVLVDDCAYTGSRLRQFLQLNSRTQIIFAHLYSHPELRDAIVSHEASILDCISARDLNDYSSEDLGDFSQSWKEQSLVQLYGKRYWVGKTDHFCFSWNEPDRFFWNSVNEKIESCWRLLPSQICLKNKYTPPMNSPTLQIQQNENTGFKAGLNVIFGEYQGKTVVCNLDKQESFCFSGVASDIWNSLQKYKNLEQVTEELLKSYEVSETILHSDIRIFVDQLHNRGLLVT